MNPYAKYVLPFLVDACCGVAPICTQRQLLVRRARGRVLEVGIGSGRNLPFYDAAKVHELVGVDPSQELWLRARHRLAATVFPVRHHATTLSAASVAPGSIDTAIVTYTLCSIPEPVAVLKHLRTLLAPGARLLFCEHGTAPDDSVRRWQRRLNGLWCRLAGGCNLDRDVSGLLRSAGYELEELQTEYLPRVPRWVGFHYRGCAVVADPSAPPTAPTPASPSQHGSPRSHPERSGP